MLKKSDDKLAFRGVLSVASALIVLPLAFFLPLPVGQAWVFLMLGAGAHFLYQLAQISAFERGDMSLVYPVMRGVAPGLAGIIAWMFLDEALAPIGIVGLCVSIFALIGFGWPSKTPAQGTRLALGFALACGFMIAVYSVIDAAGMRVSRESLGQAWTYIVWFFLFDAVLLPSLALFRKRANLGAVIAQEWRWGAAAGAASLLTFGLALYAFSLAPVAQMSALRETSVVFGAVFAALFLREPFGAKRIGLAVLLCVGLILMQLG